MSDADIFCKEMSKEEIVEFLRKSLILVENAQNLLNGDCPKHIPAYHKILGIQQKFDRLSTVDQQNFFAQIIMIRGICSYFLNGRYKDGISLLEKLKIDFIKISIKNNENIKNIELSKNI